jgi:hypothetical protein
MKAECVQKGENGGKKETKSFCLRRVTKRVEKW